MSLRTKAIQPAECTADDCLVSDDDFDIESRALAEEYAEAREKGSNVKTRRKGMVGKYRSKQSGTSYQRRGVQSKVGTESIDSSDDDDGEVVVRRKRKGLREEMAYEGRRFTS